MIQASLFALGLLCLIAAAGIEWRRPDDPRIAHLQEALAGSKAENVRLIEMDVAKAMLIQKLKGYLDQIVVAQRGGSAAPKAPAPPP
jgi:hypothetical protein